MSYHRTSEAAPTSSATSVTVCTNDVALCNLVENALPVAVPDSLGYAELLVPQMVELEDDEVGLSAVDARMLAQERDQILQPFGGHDPLSLLCLVDVALAIGLVVLLLVRGPARSAVVVALAPRLAPPSEVLEWLLVMTAPAPPHAGKVEGRTDVPLGASIWGGPLLSAGS